MSQPIMMMTVNTERNVNIFFIAFEFKQTKIGNNFLFPIFFRRKRQDRHRKGGMTIPMLSLLYNHSPVDHAVLGDQLDEIHSLWIVHGDGAFIALCFNSSHLLSQLVEDDDTLEAFSLDG